MSNILSIFQTVYTEIQNLTPELYPYFTYRRWEADTPLEDAVAKDLTRSFRVGLGRQTIPIANSHRDLKRRRAPLLIAMGYPLQLIDPNDTYRLGVEGMIASDTVQIVNRFYYQRPSIIGSVGNARLLGGWEATRQGKLNVIGFNLEWGEVLS